jgi:hypothetical protein
VAHCPEGLPGGLAGPLWPFAGLTLRVIAAPAAPSLSQRTGTVMVLWASALSLAASSAGLIMLGSNPILGELSALGFAVSLFIIICASEALNEGSRD